LGLVSEILLFPAAATVLLLLPSAAHCALMIEHRGLSLEVSTSSEVASVPGFEIEAGEDFQLFCMDEKLPTKWISTAENFRTEV
jgi:hypothetical protein